MVVDRKTNFFSRCWSVPPPLIYLPTIMTSIALALFPSLRHISTVKKALALSKIAIIVHFLAPEDRQESSLNVYYTIIHLLQKCCRITNEVEGAPEASRGYNS